MASELADTAQFHIGSSDELGPFRVGTCDSVDTFLNCLSPNGPIFGSVGLFREGSWVFRGQADATWPLVPNALRVGANLLGLDYHSPAGMSWTQLRKTSDTQVTNAVQFEAEYQTLCAFFWLADSKGLPLPEDGQILRQCFERTGILGIHRKLLEELRKQKCAWPPREGLNNVRTRARSTRRVAALPRLALARRAFRAAFASFCAPHALCGRTAPPSPSTVFAPSTGSTARTA